MGWWFGRKSAPADVRPFVPAWLSNDLAEVGFARSYSEQVDEIYRRNPVGQRAVRLVAGMLGSLTIDVVEGDARAGELVRADGLLEGIAANLLLSYEPADGSVLSAEQFIRLKDELAAEFSGSGNAGRPLLLEGGLKWQALSLTPADMDFVALKEGAARDIALAFGVPPVLVGLPGDATYANAREAGRALYRQTILPMVGRVLNALGAMLGDWMGPVKLAVDTDQISELAEDRAKLWEQVEAASFLSDAEKRDMLGFAK